MAHIKRRPRSKYGSGSVGLADFSDRMETTRIRGGVVLLGGGWEGWPEREARKSSRWRVAVLCVPRAVGSEVKVLSGCDGEFLGAWDDFC